MLDLEEIHLKLNNDPFMFRRFEKIDWKQFASFNLEQFKLTGGLTNWELMEKHLGHVLCCHLESEFDSNSLDPNLAKLFQLAQLSVEYLLRIRQQALTELKVCREQLTSKTEALNAAVKAKAESEKRCKELKKQLKKSSSPVPSAKNSDYFRCPACPKTFLNGEYLRSHWIRRHPAELMTPKIQKEEVKESKNDEEQVVLMKELKERLSNAEKQLKDEQLLLQTFVDKMDKSNNQLQGMLFQEVQSLKAQLIPIPSATSSPLHRPPAIQTLPDAGIPVSPIKIVVESSPIKFKEPEASPMKLKEPEPSPIKLMEPKPSPIKSKEPEPSPILQEVAKKFRSVLQRSYVMIEADDPIEMNDALPVASSSPVIPEEESSIEMMPIIHHQKKPKKLNREELEIRFKSAIQRTLQRRLTLLGIDDHQMMTSSRFRRIMDQLNNNKDDENPQRQKIRRRFLAQLQLRISNGNIKSSKKNKIKKETVIVHQPERAPVPIPRSYNRSLMARDGEATTVKNLSRHLTNQVLQETAGPGSHQVVVKPSKELVINKSTSSNSVKEEVKVDDRKPSDQIDGTIIIQKSDDDESSSSSSFSLSSLDAILNELKKPNRYSSLLVKSPSAAAAPSSNQPVNSNQIIKSASPATTKTVQWRVPVESMEKPLDHSWDS